MKHKTPLTFKIEGQRVDVQPSYHIEPDMTEKQLNNKARNNTRYQYFDYRATCSFSNGPDQHISKSGGE